MENMIFELNVAFIRGRLFCVTPPPLSSRASYAFKLYVRSELCLTARQHEDLTI